MKSTSFSSVKQRLRILFHHGQIPCSACIGMKDLSLAEIEQLISAYEQNSPGTFPPELDIVHSRFCEMIKERRCAFPENEVLFLTDEDINGFLWIAGQAVQLPESAISNSQFKQICELMICGVLEELSGQDIRNLTRTQAEECIAAGKRKLECQQNKNTKMERI